MHIFCCGTIRPNFKPLLCNTSRLHCNKCGWQCSGLSIHGAKYAAHSTTGQTTHNWADNTTHKRRHAQGGRHIHRADMHSRADIQGHKGREVSHTVNLQNCNSMDLLLFAQPGSKVGNYCNSNPDLRNLAPARFQPCCKAVSIWLPRFQSWCKAVSISLKKQVDKCKNRPLAAKSNLGGNFVQFWFLENKYSGLLIGTRLL